MSTDVDDKNIFGELLPGGEGLLAKGEKPAFTWKKDGTDFDPEERFKVRLCYFTLRTNRNRSTPIGRTPARLTDIKSGAWST